MIHVGIDVTNIFWPVRTGVHRYCYGLIEGLMAIKDMEGFHISLIDLDRVEQHQNWLPSRPGIIDYSSSSLLPWLPTIDTGPSGQLGLSERLWNRSMRELRHLAYVGGLTSPDFLSEVDLFHAWHLKPVYGAKRSTIMIHDAYQLLNPDLFHADVVSSHRKCLEFAKNEASTVLVPSKYTADAIIHELGVDESKVRVIYHGVDSAFKPGGESTDRIEALKKYNLSDRPYLLSVGYLDPRKNVEGHLKAFERVAFESGLEDLYFVLVGPDDARTDPLLNMIKSSKVRDRIIVTGFVQEDDLPLLYNGASAFVYCSHYEGFGLPIIEAMACGTPVITSNRTCLPEIAGDAAIIVDSESVDEMSEAILRVCSDGSLNQELRGKGLERSSQFTWEKSAREHLIAYEESL